MSVTGTHEHRLYQGASEDPRASWRCAAPGCPGVSEMGSTARELVEIEDGTGARFTMEKGHDCLTDPGCCEECETHQGCRCGDDNGYYGGTYA